MSRASCSGKSSQWVMVMALIALIVMIHFLTIYRDSTFCPRCWKERIWLAQRWAEKILFKRQEIIDRASCKSNLKQLAMAMELYALKHGGKFPSYQTWEQQTWVYLKNWQIYKCWDAVTSQKRYYCMNPRLSNKSLKEIPEPSNTILLFECDDAGRPISRHHYLEFRHLCHVVFVDGRVKGLPVKEVELRLSLTKDQ